MSSDQSIKRYEEAVVQIATPYSTGTGFCLPEQGLVVTNEHVVRDNKEVIVIGKSIGKQLAKVRYLDVEQDLAFLSIDKPPQVSGITLYHGDDITVGQEVIAIGHPFGLGYTITKGIISSMDHRVSKINYIQHDAALNPGNSGGPLINLSGQILGMNTFVVKDGNNIGFSLPYHIISDALTDYLPHKGSCATRCGACQAIVEDNPELNHCSKCGAEIEMISQIAEYEPLGVNKSLEKMIGDLGYEVSLSRTGPSSWTIHQGSAVIKITYHEKSGLITGDAHLCALPEDDIISLYTFLLTENYHLDGLTFSVKDRDIVLSLLIYDQYFNPDNARTFFEELFLSADHYDNILVERFGATWDSENQS